MQKKVLKQTHSGFKGMCKNLREVLASLEGEQENKAKMSNVMRQSEHKPLGPSA